MPWASRPRSQTRFVSSAEEPLGVAGLDAGVHRCLLPQRRRQRERGGGDEREQCGNPVHGAHHMDAGTVRRVITRPRAGTPRAQCGSGAGARTRAAECGRAVGSSLVARPPDHVAGEAGGPPVERSSRAFGLTVMPTTRCRSARATSNVTGPSTWRTAGGAVRTGGGGPGAWPTATARRQICAGAPETRAAHVVVRRPGHRSRAVQPRMRAFWTANSSSVRMPWSLRAASSLSSFMASMDMPPGAGRGGRRGHRGLGGRGLLLVGRRFVLLLRTCSAGGGSPARKRRWRCRPRPRSWRPCA